MSRRLGQVAALLAAAACGPSPLGEAVSDGVAHALVETRANGTDLVRVDVVFPADGARPRRGPFPAVVFIQGGFVGPARYRWQAEALAREGYVVALPEHHLDLAFFGIENGVAARQLLVDAPAGTLLEGLVEPSQVAVAGHSLGGVVAVKLALGGGFSALLVEASFQDPADQPAFEQRWRGPTLYLAGERDCNAKLSSVRAGFEKAPAPAALAVLAGVTHFQFTVSGEEDAKRGCSAEASLEDAHARITAASLAFLRAAMPGGTVGEAALRAVPGAQVEVR